MGLREFIHKIPVVAGFSMLVKGIDLIKHILHTYTHKWELMDRNADVSISLTSFSGCRLSSVTVRHIIDPYYQRILDKYGKVYQTQSKLPYVARHVVHCITTTGPPVFSEA